MKETRILMGMPVTVEVVDLAVTQAQIDEIFAYFTYVDEKFSTYKETSEISLINRQALSLDQASHDMRTIFALAEQTKRETNGFFDIQHNGQFDPSGIVKGWAIANAADILREKGFTNYYVEAGGDIQVSGRNSRGEPWRIGIRNPFNLNEIVKVVALSDGGIATSGTYIRGQHIYNPKKQDELITDVMSLTVIGPDIYNADRFATAAFAMGREGVMFIARLEGFEGYQIDCNGQATFTPDFARYVQHV